jgi:HlyD family secretion protein
MEARVDIGEMDIVLLQAGQKAKLEVDSFKDKKFTGVVTAVANSSEGLNASRCRQLGSSSSSFRAVGDAISGAHPHHGRRIFRPGMSVTATIETRTRTNAIAAPIASVTTRVAQAEKAIRRPKPIPCRPMPSPPTANNGDQFGQGRQKKAMKTKTSRWTWCLSWKATT